jgi:single-strand DNA-binding protein
VADLGLAVNRRYTNGGGELKEDVLFVTVVAWGKQGETAAQYLAKGSPVHVEGRLQSRSWETKEGDKRMTFEVVAERLQFLGRKPEGAGPPDCTDAPPEEVPF